MTLHCLDDVGLLERTRVQKQSNIRQRLMTAYERLSPLQQALVQLSSVIYEQATIKDFYNCLCKTGLTFNEEPLSSPDHLTAHLNELQQMRLLDKHLRCHQGIVEVVNRLVVCAESEIRRENLSMEIAVPAAWTDRESVKQVCLSCRSQAPGLFLQTRLGWLCESCVLSELQSMAMEEDLTAWRISQFKQALCPGSDLYRRLAVLWRFDKVLQLCARENPAEADGLMPLLISQLGFEEPVPLAQAVRKTAHDAVVQLGRKILPLLLQTRTTDSWLLYGNVLSAAGSIAPENLEVRDMLEKAARHPNPQIRKQVVMALYRHQSGWSKGMRKLHAHDRDEAVREQVETFIPLWMGGLGSSPRSQPRPIAPSALSRYQIMVRAVRQELPARLEWFHASTRQCQRIMREMRIGIYSHDENLCHRSRNLIHSSCRGTPYAQSDPFAQVVMNPFDGNWFRTLPVNLQCTLLSSVFVNTMVHLQSDDELLDYALDPEFIHSLPKPVKAKLLSQIICRLLIGGQLEQAQQLIDSVNPATTAGAGLTGWLLFLRGKNDEAVSAFERDVQLWRKAHRKRSGYLAGMPGLFNILALLKQGEPLAWKRIDQIASTALSNFRGDDFLDLAYSSLKAIVHTQYFEMESARIQIAKSDGCYGLPIFFSAFASYWMDGHLNQDKIDALSRLFVASREIGLDWLAMESAELLCRTEQRTPIRDNYVHKVQDETGMRSFLPAIKVEEGWRKSLRALEQIAQFRDGSGEHSRDVRLIWLLGINGSEVTLEAKEQRISTKGTWTKGRALSVASLREGRKIESASRQDEAVIAAIERSSSHHYNDYRFNMDKALPALAGHPLVFLEENSSVPIEIVKGEPEITVTQSGSKLTISLFPTPGKQRVLLVRETPTRFKVVEFLEAHRRVAELLGEKGLMVPSSARQEVLTAIAAASSLVTVHSAIGGDAGDIVEIEADPTPRLHFMPAGSGFKIEVFVKPFADGGPYLKPGVGANNLIVEINGRRMQARRNLAAENKKAAAVEAISPVLASYCAGEKSWLLQEPETCLQVLLDLKALQDKGDVILEWPEGEKLKVSREVSFNQLRMRIHSKTDWFELSGELRVDDEVVMDMLRLLDLLQTTDSRFIPLGEGHFVALTHELRRRLEEVNAYSEKRGKSIGLHPLTALAMEDLTEKLVHLETDKEWKARLDRIRSAKAFNPLIPSTFKGDLRDYQIEGYQWLVRLAYMGVGACLADDMGLGKTIQALGVVLDRAPKGPSLVVAPTSVCMNWVAEANRFAPTLNVHQFSVNDREALIDKLKAHDVLVTSYGLLYQEIDHLSRIEWATIVLDEAQAIKNIATKRSQAAMSLKGEFKLITTGTPIENHLSELWTLFNFINPGLLGSYKKFNERFALPIERYNDREAKKRLKKLIQPFILRRTKSQVLEELPPRTDVLLRVEMSREEESFYEALRRQSLQRLEADSSPMHQKQLKILAEIMRLRQASCNARLVVPETDVPSAKLELFGEIVSELIENGHKALVFSQFVGHLTLIREYLDHRHIDYRYLDGSTPPAERNRQVEAFQAGKGDLFLISLKAGGLGLNLTAADYVIHMDPWWNPAVEDQASDRTHRIGQQLPVTVYRLVAKNTIEEKIVKLHREKRDLAGSLLEGSDISGKVSAEELLRLIQEC